MRHRSPWLTAIRVVMRWDKLGSEVFVVGSLLGAAALGVTHGWQGASWLLVPLIVAAAIWLALLGIVTVVGLTVTMRSGITPSDEYWHSIIGQVEGRQNVGRNDGNTVAATARSVALNISKKSK